MSELKVGDTVYVHNWGAKYTRHIDWFIDKLKEHRDDFNVSWAIRYAYDVFGEVTPGNTPYEVLYIDGTKVLITNVYGEGQTYLVDKYSLGDCPARKFRRMTKAEIESALGYEIEIIGD